MDAPVASNRTCGDGPLKILPTQYAAARIALMGERMGEEDTNELRFKLQAAELGRAHSRQVLHGVQAPLEAMSNLSYM
jgi:hypothetical protein